MQLAGFLNTILQGRGQTAADEVARPPLFLCSAQSSAITGKTINVDGGAAFFKYFFSCRMQAREGQAPRLPLTGSMRGVRQNLNRTEPRFPQLWPAGDRKFGAAKPVPMPALRKDVQLCRNLGVFQRKKINRRIFDMHRIILCLHDKRRRSLLRRVDVRVGRKVLLGNREIARINNHGKIRAATHLVSRVDRIVKAFIEMSAERGSKVRSCGKAENANAFGIDVPFGGVRTHDTNRALRILQGRRRFRVRPSVGNTVFEQHACDTDGVELIGRLRFPRGSIARMR